MLAKLRITRILLALTSILLILLIKVVILAFVIVYRKIYQIKRYYFSA